MRWLKNAWRSARAGWGGLLLVHLLGGFTGVSLGFSWLCLGAATLLGFPGVILLVLLDMMIK